MLEGADRAIGRPQLGKRQAEVPGQGDFVAPLKRSGGVEVLQVRALAEPP